MSYRQRKSDIATKAGIEFALRAQREATIMLDKPPANRIDLDRGEELSAIDQFLLDKV